MSGESPFTYLISDTDAEERVFYYFLWFVCFGQIQGRLCNIAKAWTLSTLQGRLSNIDEQTPSQF